MNEILGIDLGTSSVKALIVRDGAVIAKAKAGYDEISPEGWYAALCRALNALDLTRITAVGLSSQVGTYIIDGKDVIGWNAPVGREELCELTAHYSKENFIREIAMPHPQIISYPLPRLLHITRHYGAKSVCQPKDWLCERLTGHLVSDPWSWRGLYHPAHGMSDFFLGERRITAALPPILPPSVRRWFRLTATSSPARAPLPRWAMWRISLSPLRPVSASSTASDAWLASARACPRRSTAISPCDRLSPSLMKNSPLCPQDRGGCLLL